MALTQRQERFCYEYLADFSPSQAYLRAGYRPKDPAGPAARLMANPHVQEKINRLKAERQSALIATSAEVLQTLTRVLRREEGDQQAVVLTRRTPMGDPQDRAQYATAQQAELVQLKTPVAAVNKAAELLGKYHGLWTDKMALEVARPVILDDIRGGPMEGEADG